METIKFLVIAFIVGPIIGFAIGDVTARIAIFLHRKFGRY
jgi:hypothetical protein